MKAASSTWLARRRFCLCCIGAGGIATAGAWLTTRQSFAEARGIVDRIKDAAAAAPIAVHRLRGNVAVLEGSGGNIAALTGRDGTVMIDAGIGVSRPQLLTALGSLSSDPVTLLIDTHWHFDHADGNDWIGAQGAKIIAHANTRTHLSTTQRVEDWTFDFAPHGETGLPSEVFTGTRSLRVNDTTLALDSYAPAHTDSDISVTFAGLDIIHTGDTFWSGVYPFIDYSTGGSIDGTIRAADANIAATTDHTIIIPGHGKPVSNRADLVAFRDMLVAVREKVAGQKRQGMTLDQIIAARPTAEFDAGFGGFVITPALFIRLVFEGV